MLKDASLEIKINEILEEYFEGSGALEAIKRVKEEMENVKDSN